MNRSGYHGKDTEADKKESLKSQGWYHKKAWRRCRLQALERDHYLCQRCLKRGIIKTATEVHHLLPLEVEPSLGLELSNLESLCWQCHEETKHQHYENKRPGVKLIRISNGEDEF